MFNEGKGWWAVPASEYARGASDAPLCGAGCERGRRRRHKMIMIIEEYLEEKLAQLVPQVVLSVDLQWRSHTDKDFLIFWADNLRNNHNEKKCPADTDGAGRTPVPEKPSSVLTLRTDLSSYL